MPLGGALGPTCHWNTPSTPFSYLVGERVWQYGRSRDVPKAEMMSKLKVPAVIHVQWVAFCTVVAHLLSRTAGIVQVSWSVF